MSEKQKREYPYKSLGSWLRRMRQKNQQSLAEVSGAVEIDSETLSDIELGTKRPGEDILMLLISYFEISEQEAVEIWELAGYDKSADNRHHHAEDNTQQILVLPMDARIVYTDLAKVSTSKFGLTINFMQSDGIGGQPLAVSRVGMSREHAEKLLQTLEKALGQTQQKLLPAPKPEDNSSDK